MIIYSNNVIRKRALNFKQRARICEFFNSMGLSNVESDLFIYKLESLIRESHRSEVFFRTTNVISNLRDLLDGVAKDAKELNGYVSLVAFEDFCGYIYRLLIR